mmetsp:Transcript_1676/g.2431  ORF Transcript_1676/g.2431 Transcript_1676/m.2431 type:complete len:420 (+) Transcript_1676:522-1781(+)
MQSATTSFCKSCKPVANRSSCWCNSSRADDGEPASRSEGISVCAIIPSSLLFHWGGISSYSTNSPPLPSVSFSRRIADVACLSLRLTDFSSMATLLTLSECRSWKDEKDGTSFAAVATLANARRADRPISREPISDMREEDADGEGLAPGGLAVMSARLFSLLLEQSALMVSLMVMSSSLSLSSIQRMLCSALSIISLFSFAPSEWLVLFDLLTLEPSLFPLWSSRRMMGCGRTMPKHLARVDVNDATRRKDEQRTSGGSTPYKEGPACGRGRPPILPIPLGDLFANLLCRSLFSGEADDCPVVWLDSPTSALIIPRYSEPMSRRCISKDCIAKRNLRRRTSSVPDWIAPTKPPLFSPSSSPLLSALHKSAPERRPSPPIASSTTDLCFKTNASLSSLWTTSAAKFSAAELHPCRSELS